MKTFFLLLSFIFCAFGIATTYQFDIMQNAIFGRGLNDGDFGTTEGYGSYVDQVRKVRFICGHIFSIYPITNVSTLQPSPLSQPKGQTDILVAKIDEQTQEMIWYTYIGDSKSEYCYGMTGDMNGDIYITGATNSDFLYGQPKVSLFGTNDAYVIKMNTDGQVLWASIYGSIDNDMSISIFLDSNNVIWTAGATTVSTNLNILVSAFNSSQGQLIANNILGGKSTETAVGIAVYEDLVTIVGNTYSSDYPVTGDAPQQTLNPDSRGRISSDGIITTLRFDRVAKTLTIVYSTYFGTADSEDQTYGITYDQIGNYYILYSFETESYLKRYNRDNSVEWNVDLGSFAAFANHATGFLTYIAELNGIMSMSSSGPIKYLTLFETNSGDILTSKQIARFDNYNYYKDFRAGSAFLVEGSTAVEFHTIGTLSELPDGRYQDAVGTQYVDYVSFQRYYMHTISTRVEVVPIKPTTRALTTAPLTSSVFVAPVTSSRITSITKALTTNVITTGSIKSLTTKSLTTGRTPLISNSLTTGRVVTSAGTGNQVIPGQPCSNDRYMSCLTKSTYSTCTNGRYAQAQSCQPGLYCHQTGNYIYCY